MMIDLRSIVIDHVRTLADEDRAWPNASTAIFFYLFPVLCSVVSYFFMDLRPEIYNASLTFYGIFLGLLINIQVALFSILQRKWTIPEDAKSKHLKQGDEKLRIKLLKQSNSSISYLTLVCCLAAVTSLVLFVWPHKNGIGPAILAAISLHFFLTLLAIIERLHALFAKEYTET